MAKQHPAKAAVEETPVNKQQPELLKFNKLKEKYEFHLFHYKAHREEDAPKMRKFLLWIYKDLLKNFNGYISKDKIPAYNADLIYWNETSVFILLKDTKTLFNEIEKSLTTPAEKTTEKKALNETDSRDLWKVPEKKHGIYAALVNEKILKFSENGKPTGKIENLILTFKALHDLKLIDEDLIERQTDTRDEVWRKEFFITEFDRVFKDTTVRDGKRDYYTNVDNTGKLDRIKSIIQSALTA